MSLAAIRDKWATIMAGVSGMGVVHKYERWSAEWAPLLALYKTQAGIINGWCMMRRKTLSKRVPSLYVTRDHTFVWKGIYGLDDSAATELTFQDQIEAIQTAFDGQYNLGGLSGVVLAGPVQVAVVENRLFGSVLCHYGELHYDVQERVAYT
jgi:hypothetical protein